MYPFPAAQSEPSAEADSRGRTLYVFECAEEIRDGVACDVKGSTQKIRLAICGGPEKCMNTYVPLQAPKGAKPPNRTWTVVRVDPMTGGGRVVDSKTPGLDVWAYKGRPVYTYALDNDPGDLFGHIGTFTIASYDALMVGSSTSGSAF